MSEVTPPPPPPPPSALAAMAQQVKRTKGCKDNVASVHGRPGNPLNIKIRLSNHQRNLSLDFRWVLGEKNTGKSFRISEGFKILYQII